jgi:hypothetical protein
MNTLFPEGCQKLGGIEDPEWRVQEISRASDDNALRPGQAPCFAEDRLLEIANRTAQGSFHQVAIDGGDFEVEQPVTETLLGAGRRLTRRDQPDLLVRLGRSAADVRSGSSESVTPGHSCCRTVRKKTMDGTPLATPPPD